MDLPQSLPAQVFLLAVHPENQRLTSTSNLGKVLRAAALEDLTLRGRLVDSGGKAHVARTDRVGDAVLDVVLEQLAASKPRRWHHWVRKDAGRAKGAVRDQLAAGGWIRVEPRRVLGLFPADRIVVRDRMAIRTLRTQVVRAVTGNVPVSQLSPRDTALAALTSFGEMNTVTSNKKRRESRARIAQLLVRSGPAVAGLKKVLSDDASAAAAA